MKTLIIDKGIFFQRVALLDNGNIEYIDYKLDEKLSIGDICLAKIKTINQANQWAFLELFENQDAYLSEDISKLKQGDLILVEVVKEAFDEKLPSVTRDISIVGKNMIFLPRGKGLKYSRKLNSLENIELLTKKLEEIILGGGAILRSGADFQNENNIISELESLVKQYKAYENLAKISAKPKLIKKAQENYEELLNSKRAPYEIITNSNEIYKLIKNSNFLIEKDQLLLKETSLFSTYGITEKSILGNRYNVNGCELVIEKTEAMTIIDVNSKGKELNAYREKNILEINLSLCAKLVQLVIMKNISGIIIVDFISMKETASKVELLNKLKYEFRIDRNFVKIMEITSLGLVQIVRQRQGKAISEKLTMPCNHCGGLGYEANSNLNKIRLEEKIQLVGYERLLSEEDNLKEFFDKEENLLLEKVYKH